MVIVAPARKIPEGFGWYIIEMNEKYTAWQNGYICALSSVAHISDEHLPPHYEWLVSFSNMGKWRLSDKDVGRALKAFGAEDFEEDNHESGVARKYWMAVEEKYRRPCPCKDEMVITEGDYKYSVKLK